MTSNTTQLEELGGAASPDSPPPDQPGQTLGDTLMQYWRLLRSYYWVVIVTCTLTVAAAYVYTRQQPNIYEASAKVIYHEKTDNLFGKHSTQVDMLGTGGARKFERFWNTQKEIFESRWFAQRVAERGEDGEEKPPPLIEHEAFLPAEEGRDYQQRLEAAIDQILSATDVSLKQGSRVAVVRAETRDPAIARLLADRVADEYTAYTEEFQSQGLEKINQFFDEHVTDKRQKLEEAQSKLQQFKQDNNILSFSYEDRQNLTASNMESVNKKLAEVRDNLSSERTLLHQIESMDSSGHEHRAIADLVENETLKAAFEKEAELEAKLGRLQTRYLDKHPKVEAVTRELNIVRENIDREIERMRAAIQNRVELLERRKRDLENELSRLKQKLLDLDKLGGKYSQLKNRKTNLRELYDTMLTRASELDINSAYESDDIEVLEEAQTPESPVSPSLPMNLGAGVAVGLLLGFGGIVLIEALDTTIRSEEDIDRYTDKPILALLPRLDADVLAGLEAYGDSAADTITHFAPKSSFAEGIKTLRTNLTFMSPDNPPSTILVTSAGPGEGKTISSVNMAIAIAQSGSETLLVDTDLRRPRIHNALDLDKTAGVSGLIRGESTLQTAVQSTDIEDLFCLTSGEVPPNPSEMLHSDRFHDLVDQMRRQFDRVIFDSPPLAAVSDALIISNTVDGALLVVEFGKTRRETFLRSLERLHGVGAPLLGFVLNSVARNASGYGYPYYRYSY